VRVVAGTHGGRRLKAPPGSATRPTSDRVREALFSILGDGVVGSRVLDLFAGSGALGIEAISRGAAHVTFVDSSPAARKALTENLATLGIEAVTLKTDALKWLRSAANVYDLVFLDPPYDLAERLGPELSVALPAVLAPGATVVAESDRRQPLEIALPLKDERRYGDTLIRIHES
jgi:16S rRNA (guanine(966)-N(2))-methyltransferase RsmD